MKSLLLASSMMAFALAASAQTMPGVPNLPMQTSPTITAPSVPSPPTETTPTPTTPSVNAPSASSIPGTEQTANPIDIEKAKTEAECKIPTNATKPECIELMMKK